MVLQSKMKQILHKIGKIIIMRSKSNIKPVKNLNALIEKNRSIMTKSQCALADFVLENIDDVGFLTYSEISKRSGVSEASFIRFLRMLGFGGFAEFKESLKQHIKAKTSPSIRMKETISKIQKKENVYKNALSIDMAMLREVEENWSEKDTEKAVSMIKNARRIYVAGFGISRSVVEFINFRFNRLGYPVVPLTIGGAEIVEKLFSANSSDIIITIGFFRPHREISIIYTIAGEKGIQIIALTDSFASPLAEGADVVLHARRGPREIITSLVAPMAVANILSLALAIDDENRALDSFSDLEKIKNEFNL